MRRHDKADDLSAYYSDLLETTYDCPDRIVLNGYDPFACSPGGFRAWWRRLYGDDSTLSDSTLQRFSGRFSRRLRAYADANGIPVVTSNAHERKHLIAESYLPIDPSFTGLFLVIIGRAPGFVWTVLRSKAGTIRNIERKTTQTYVNHYTFHIIDSDWGHVSFKICGQPPFAAQICLNGHEYLARQALRKGVSFFKEGNCFTSASGGAALARIAETLRSPNAVGRLARTCDRWIYSACLCFALPTEDQQRSGFTYSYSVYQLEYSRNLLFRRGADLDRAAQAIIDHTRLALDVPTVRTIFGAKKRPKFHRKGGKVNRLEVAVERPTYDLTVMKLHFGRLTLKAYTKGERVLRFEAIVHNTAALRTRRSIASFPEIVLLLKAMIERFLDVLARVDTPSITCDTWDDLPRPSRLGATPTPGIDISSPRMRAVISAAIALAANPNGFTVRELAAKTREVNRSTLRDYKPWHAAYDLRKLRAKGFIGKIPASHRYSWSSQGLRNAVALTIIVDRVLRPVLAGAGKPRPGRPPKREPELNLRYQAIHNEMRKLLTSLGVAA